ACPVPRRAQRTGSRRPRAAVPAARDVRGPGRGREFLAFPDSDVHVQAPRTTTVAAIPAATPASSRMRRPMAATGVSQTWYPFRGDCHVRKFCSAAPDLRGGASATAPAARLRDGSRPPRPGLTLFARCLCAAPPVMRFSWGCGSLRRQSWQGAARCLVGSVFPGPQALAHDRGEQDAGVGDDEHPVVEQHAVGDEADRGQALADEQPARHARSAIGHLLADLPHQRGEQDRRGGPADPVRVHGPPAPPRASSGSWPWAWVAAAAACPTATAIWLSPPTTSPIAYSPGVRVRWWRSTGISPTSVRRRARPSVGTDAVEATNEHTASGSSVAPAPSVGAEVVKPRNEYTVSGSSVSPSPR